MAIKLKSTGSLAENGVKLLVYGAAGSGKTTLIKTLPNVIVLSAEGGLLSIQDANLPYLEIGSMEDLREAFTWCKESKEAAGFESVVLDSISEVAEVVLHEELKKQKDGRAAYGEMNTTMQDLIRAFRDLPGKHVFMTAKLEKAATKWGEFSTTPECPVRA
jgi:phage nucleotide-binding protein